MMDDTKTLAYYRTELGWNQIDVCQAAINIGLTRPNGEPIMDRAVVSNAERGVRISKRSAAVIAKALNYGYEKAGLPERFTAETILEFVRQEGQKRAEEKRENPDSPKEEEGPVRFALAG